jgi:hypothetical protein
MLHISVYIYIYTYLLYYSIKIRSVVSATEDYTFFYYCLYPDIYTFHVAVKSHSMCCSSFFFVHLFNIVELVFVSYMQRI